MPRLRRLSRLPRPRRKLRARARQERGPGSPEQSALKLQKATSGTTMHCGRMIWDPCRSFAVESSSTRVLLGSRCYPLSCAICAATTVALAVGCGARSASTITVTSAGVAAAKKQNRKSLVSPVRSQVCWTIRPRPRLRRMMVSSISNQSHGRRAGDATKGLSWTTVSTTR